MNPYFTPRPPKSLGASIALTLLFGPFGLFYASIIGGLVMSFLVPICLIGISIISAQYNTIDPYDFLMILFSSWIIVLIIYWPICIVCGVVAVGKYSKKVYSEASTQMLFGNNVNSHSQTTSVSNASLLQQ